MEGKSLYLVRRRKGDFAEMDEVSEISVPRPAGGILNSIITVFLKLAVVCLDAVDIIICHSADAACPVLENEFHVRLIFSGDFNRCFGDERRLESPTVYSA